MSNMTASTPAPTAMRDVFIAETTRLLQTDPRLALVLSDISAADSHVLKASADHPDRVINVGIREQLMISVAGGLALTGMRPIAHSYAPFLIERAFEQIKLDFEHQGVTGVLASVGASYDWSQGGYTHFCPRDVALLDTIPGWRIEVPGHPDEVTQPLRLAAASEESTYIRLSLRRNSTPHVSRHGELTVLRTGSAAAIIAVGTALDNVLSATEGMDVTVAYATTVRPFDTTTLRQLGHDTIAIVEPYLAGTSHHLISTALADRPHRVLSLGVRNKDLHAFGTPTDHDMWHRLDPASLKEDLRNFIN